MRELESLNLQWENAVKQAEQTMRPYETERTVQFHSPQQLLDEFQRMAESDKALERFITKMTPYLMTLKDLTTMFLLYMRPFALETGLLWKAFHLAVDVSSPS